MFVAGQESIRISLWRGLWASSCCRLSAGRHLHLQLLHHCFILWAHLAQLFHLIGSGLCSHSWDHAWHHSVIIGTLRHGLKLLRLVGLGHLVNGDGIYLASGNYSGSDHSCVEQTDPHRFSINR